VHWFLDELDMRFEFEQDWTQVPDIFVELVSDGRRVSYTRLSPGAAASSRAFVGKDHGETDRGVQGAHLNPLGLFLNPLGLFLLTYILLFFLWRILSAFQPA
jgi:hypothetical protein